MKEKEIEGSLWDVFIHVLAVIALYVSIVGALTVLFQYVNLSLTDTADVEVDVRDRIRWGVASLLIFFPAYVWAWRLIEMDLSENPEKKKLWVRTCPIYLTLFLAGLLALSDLACLVYYFMSGDLTSRFLLKVIAVLLVSGAVLWFYLSALRRVPGPLPSATRAFAYATFLLVGLLVIAGFATAGSPSRAHLARLDVTRIENLQDIQREIVEYWQNKMALPTSLDQLSDSISGFSPPRDPATSASYGYHAVSPTSFELCADFALRDFDTEHTLPSWTRMRLGKIYWNHEAGHFCFSRTIDPARHPPHKPEA
ncbi:MAG: DUF5671 domain-containing protein [Candidatus Binatus sp.]|uniref:DUF5671 domain-containing protein n=1 Tax=Candidatus Binatus sp. TaxID=2811406 RepID=UPI00271791CC|nr:DUF5671 domain-containing protein [Candidatus Binatus sp.]MDO8433762.1 DUF5671 domain-containing protein [Candidatus Binatus sp.]